MTKRGVSAVEVLIATAIVAVALVTVMGLSQSHTRQAYFTEYHVQAQWRAAAILGSLATRHPPDLESELRPGGLPADGSELAVHARLLPEPGRVVMEWVPAKDAPPGKALERAIASPSRGALFSDAAFISRVRGGPAGTLLYRYRAVVKWSFPGDTKEHSYEAERLIARPGLAFQLRPALEGGAR